MMSCLPLESKRLPIALRVIALISFPCPFRSPLLFTPYAIRLACDSPRLPTLAFFVFAVRYPPFLFQSVGSTVDTASLYSPSRAFHILSNTLLPVSNYSPTCIYFMSALPSAASVPWQVPRGSPGRPAR